MSGCKVIVAGDTKGRFSTLFGKVSKAMEKAEFSALLCVGTFFDCEGNKELQPYLRGELKVPLKTYFILGEHDTDTSLVPKEASDSEGADLCPNLHYLGRRGLATLGEGITVAFLSGSYKPDAFMGAQVPTELRYYHRSDLQHLLTKTVEKVQDVGVDVLLTSEWGQGFGSLLPSGLLPEGLDADSGSPIVALLASRMAARYHFASGQDRYFKLPPYKNKLHSTRFYGLAAVGDKETWKQAISVVPVASVDPTTFSALQQGATNNPYMTEDTQEETQLEGVVEQNGMEFNASNGDWECFFCHNWNFARQTHCHRKKCQLPRTGEGPKKDNLGKKVAMALTKEQVEAEAIAASERALAKATPKRVSLYHNQRTTKNKKKKN
eukprot:gb/GEZN01007789.1/.p1 GENE.gb/GEZN01007789.1/~~gb/GEZN01007789.1/.p1  ORF type:complete len:380 (-),score=70.83 gb/GEZN01007789.1/:221-1360(-)